MGIGAGAAAAGILRELGQGQTAGQVARQTGVASKTVRAIARRYEEEGLESALYEKSRPGPRRVLGRGPESAHHRPGVRPAAIVPLNAPFENTVANPKIYSSCKSSLPSEPT
jgi:hypothetical protein